MNPRITAATAGRVLTQVRHDPRTVGLLLLVPSLLLGLMAWIFTNTPTFGIVGPALLALFPFTTMFLVTSITMLRERRSGTLERLMTLPLGRFDLLLGYTIAFGALAVLQSLIAVGFAVWVCGLAVSGNAWLLVLVAVADALLGTTLGLMASAFAGTEFQVVQFLPALVFPQVLLGGILVARDRMPDVLHTVSDCLPLSYAIEALQSVSTDANGSDTVLHDVLVVALFAVAFVVLGAVTLRRSSR